MPGARPCERRGLRCRPGRAPRLLRLGPVRRARQVRGGHRYPRFPAGHRLRRGAGSEVRIAAGHRSGREPRGHGAGDRALPGRVPPVGAGRTAVCHRLGDQIHGTEDDVSTALGQLVSHTGADEILVHTSTFDREDGWTRIGASLSWPARARRPGSYPATASAQARARISSTVSSGVWSEVSSQRPRCGVWLRRPSSSRSMVHRL